MTTDPKLEKNMNDEQKAEVSPEPVSVSKLLSGSAEQVKAEETPLWVIDEYAEKEMAKAQATGRWMFMVARVEYGKVYAEWKTNNFPSEDIAPALDLLKSKLSGEIAGPEVVTLPQAKPLQVARVEDFLPGNKAPEKAD